MEQKNAKDKIQQKPLNKNCIENKPNNLSCHPDQALENFIYNQIKDDYLSSLIGCKNFVF